MSKIISLQASNFKKLTAVEITPSGNVIILTGENGAGKSSILDAIESALSGGKTIPDEPIRRGASKGFISLMVGDLKVTRTFTPSGGGTLRVEDASGNVKRSPQAILDKLVGNLSFDPLAFSRLKSHEQWEQLRELVGLDFKKLDADRLKAYEERTIVNRELLRLQTLLKEIPPNVDEAPNMEISATVVLEEIEKADALNDKLADLDERIKKTNSQFLDATNQVTEAEVQISEIEKSLREWNEELQKRKNDVIIVTALKERLMEEWRRAPAEISTAPLKEKLKSLEIENMRVREKQNRQRLIHSIKLSQETSEALTHHIEGIDETKVQMISEAKFPLVELSFNGDQVTYKGFQFAQVSDGEKLRVSVAVGMALNPDLRVIFVRDGSLLDANGLKTIADLAATNDYQVWLEDARSVDPSAIEIVDGHIKEIK